METADKIIPPLSRRDFHKLTLGAGLAMAADSLITGCGNSSTSSPPKNSNSTVSLHFNLSHLPADATNTLRVAGKRYVLSPHTTDSLNTAIAAQPFLADKQNVTHYATDVSMPDHKPLHFNVTTHDPRRGHGLVMTGIYISEQARARVRSSTAKVMKTSAKSATAFSCKTVSSSIECDLADQASDNFHTVFDAAKAIVFHHTEIASLDPDIAAQILAHIEASGAVANLALKICQLGPAYEHDPTGYYLDGWCVLVPVMNSDGTPKLDSSGMQLYDYRFNADLNDDIRTSVNDVLKSIKNDPTLKEKMYTSHPQGSGDDTSITAKMAKRIRLWKSGGTEMVTTVSGFTHNVWFDAPTYTGSGDVRSFKIVLDNWNFLCYGLYVEYLDANGQPIAQQGGGMLDGLKSRFSLESDTCKFLTIIMSPPTFFGVPLPSPKEVDITLPNGAFSARLMLCGPGAYGKVDFPSSIIIGSLVSIIINFCIPTYSLISGTGLSETSSLRAVLEEYFKSIGNVFKLISILLGAVSDAASPDSAKTIALAGSLEGLIASFGQALLQFLYNGELPAISKWLVTNTAEGEIEEAIPFAGWALRIAAVAGTVADIATGVAEALAHPMVIDNTITFSNSVDITVNCDPGNSQFPDEATYYEVQFTVAGSSYPAIRRGFPLDQVTRGKRTMTFTFDGVPTSGRSTDSVDIWYFSNSSRGWLAAHGKATFANVVSPINLTAAITIEQNPIPISATTLYYQKRKLAFNGGKYVWNEGPSLANPVVETSNCTNSGLCGLGDISVWVPGGMIGYSWQIGNSYKVKNINSQEADPAPGMKLLDPSSIGAPTPVAYDMRIPYTNLTGNHFYLDVVNPGISDGEYHLRKLNLDSSSGTFKTTGSWGRFRIQLDRLAVHKDGYVVGISSVNSKIAVLKLDNQAYPDDDHCNNAVVMLGEGTGDKLILYPQALTIASTGEILILQGQNTNMSVKAFKLDGEPCPYFSNNAISFSLVSVDANAQWLDIAIDATDLIYILSYTGTGQMQSDYHLDVYDKSGNRIVRNTGIAVYSMVVDKFRRLYSLNQETIKGSPIVEPSVSVWLPTVPS